MAELVQLTKTIYSSNINNVINNNFNQLVPQTTQTEDTPDLTVN